MAHEESIFDEQDEWLHPKWIVCAACQRSLFRTDTSPFDHETYLYCDRCPIRVGVSVYDPVHIQIMQSLPPFEDDWAKFAAVRQTIEDRLKPCQCGGTFRYNAPRRCFTCATPVIIDDANGVDLYPDEDVFILEENLDPERRERLERWRAEFFPQNEDKWKAPL